ncbi:MAG: hypothetical protein ACRDS0_38205, partial [Pseudonocardiaceae bacterium]
MAIRVAESIPGGLLRLMPGQRQTWVAWRDSADVVAWRDEPDLVAWRDGAEGGPGRSSLPP